ncbi:MAG: RNA replicase beta chain [Sanya fiers-like virus 17]|nr:MAG: RNA replicase beta chain [Sanya fiers-like virus 17]
MLTQDVRMMALTYMECLNCPRALTVAILVRYAEWDQLVRLDVDPLHHSDPEAFWAARAATDLLRKYRGEIPGIDRKAAAIEKWWWAEKECYKTNERLSPLLYGGTHGGPYGERMQDFVSDVRKEIAFLLGDRPSSDLVPRFGPGATQSDKSRFCTVPDKLSSVPTLTPNCWPFLVPWAGTKWATAQAELGQSPRFIRGNAFFSVPKTALTERGCGKEPSLNVAYQLAVGEMMKRRLKHAGLDLRENQSVHKQVACRASKLGDMATIDLSAASDTVSYNLVKLLLPHAWFQLLDALRSPMTFLEGKWVRLEKFSSMGNGFTFELETAIFAALVSVATNHTVRYGRELFVYGDDIIVPAEHYSNVVACLRFFGFTPNVRKSFHTGVFRESCGGDFFDGVGVRPFNLEEDPNEPQKLISFANGVRRVASQYGSHPNRFSRVLRAWHRILDAIPHDIRVCRGPEALGDLVIHDSEERWIKRWRSSGIRYVRCYRPANYRVVRWEGFAYCVQMAALLHPVSSPALWPSRPLGLDTSPGTNPMSYREDARALARSERYVIPRDGVAGYKVGWVPFS